jgi:hypothetical protein
MRRRLITLVAAVTIAAVAVPALASAGGIGETTSTTDPETGLVYAGVTVYQGGWRGAPRRCTYQHWSTTLIAGGVPHPGVFKTAGGVLYTLYLRTCPGDPWIKGFEGKLAGTQIWVPTPDPGGALPRIAGKGLERLAPKPVFESAPAGGETFVKLDTWFWTTTAFDPVKVTASVPLNAGSLWATTMATPVALTYTPGDGDLGTGPVTCTGPGEVWEETYGDERPTSCMYQFLHSSAVAPDGQRFHGTISIDWKVTFSNSLGGAGSLAPFTTTTPVDMTVKEIQAVVTA